MRRWWGGRLCCRCVQYRPPTSPSACSRLFTLASHSAPPIHTATLSQDPRPPRDAEVCNGLT